MKSMNRAPGKPDETMFEALKALRERDKQRARDAAGLILLRRRR